MARKTPTVRGDTLISSEGAEGWTITVGTPAWFAWLDQASSFFFESPLGRFGARRERSQRGGWYWRARRRQAGKLHRAYLGKTEALTPKLLNEVAAALAALGTDPELRSAASTDSGKSERLPDTLSPRAGIFVATDKRPTQQEERERPGDLLLATKLLLPPARPALAPRPRLAERLDAILQHKLTLISAPAGFGKTTLLSEWSRDKTFPIAWVSLDPSDDDPVRFWAYLVAAFQRLHPNVGESALGLLRSPEDLPIEASLAALINGLTSVAAESVLILDDYYAVASEAIHGSLDYFLDHLPPQVHVVIATRVDPPLALARLRGRGQMLELRVADLSFSGDETATLLKQVLKLELSDAEVATLWERTEGWAVGLQVAALSLQSRQEKGEFVKSFAGEHRHIMDYLQEEVLNRQPEAVRTFLYETAILERMCAPLCEALTGEAGGQAMLESLERANLFTLPLDGERCWYRYHRLFADFLRAGLQETAPECVPELHRRACNWYAEHDLPHEAIGHALAAREFDLAGQLIERWGKPLIKRGELITVIGWLSSLPEAVIRASPRLCVLSARTLASTSRLGAAEAFLQQAEARLAAALAELSDRPPEDADLRSIADEALILRLQIAVSRGNWRLASWLGRRALERAAREEREPEPELMVTVGDALWWSGDIVGARRAFAQASTAARLSGELSNVISSLCSLASVQRLRGRLRDAARIYEQVLGIISEQDVNLSTGASWPYLGLGRLCYEWNDLGAARTYAEKAIELTQDTDMVVLLLGGYALLERVKQAEGDLDGALAINEQAQQLAHLHDNRRELPLLKAYQARLWLMQGNLEAALDWARESGLSTADPPSYEHETEHMALAQVLLTQGDTDRTLGLLERLRKAAEAQCRVASVIRIDVLAALARQARGETDEALIHLANALRLGEPEGFVRAFVDRGASVASLLAKLLERRRRGSAKTVPDPSLTYVRRLLAAFPEEIPSTPGEIARPSPDQIGITLLSDREREVLQLIAVGLSAREIAQELVISVNTAKSHLQHIYAKLNTRGGKETIAKARALKLL